jgi:hypothetical protein
MVLSKTINPLIFWALIGTQSNYNISHINNARLDNTMENVAEKPQLTKVEAQRLKHAILKQKKKEFFERLERGEYASNNQGIRNNK